VSSALARIHFSNAVRWRERQLQQGFKSG
jgi:hypothetical protein